MITKERKKEVTNKFALSNNDTGSVEVQVGVLTDRINQISNHLQSFSKDKHSRLGLIKLVGKKRRLLRYLEKHNKSSYDNVMAKLKSL